MGNLYRVTKEDCTRAGTVLADAFAEDPAWKMALEGFTPDQRSAFFEGAVRYCVKFGDIFATSEKLEGLIVTIHSSMADMTFWRTIRSGSIIPMFRMPMRLGLKLRDIFDPLEKDRKENMKGIEHIYLMILGVGTKHQGKGHGKRLLETRLEELDKTGLPVYLETGTEHNVAMYEKRGFRVIKEITLPIVDLPHWEMLREPQG